MPPRNFTTPRELVDDADRQILQLLANGMSADEAASIIGYSAAAIHKRLRTLRIKLGMRTRAAMMVWAGQTGVARVETIYGGAPAYRYSDGPVVFVRPFRVQ